jgi:hypothetical protein
MNMPPALVVAASGVLRVAALGFADGGNELALELLALEQPLFRETDGERKRTVCARQGGRRRRTRSHRDDCSRDFPLR